MRRNLVVVTFAVLLAVLCWAPLRRQGKIQTAPGPFLGKGVWIYGLDAAEGGDIEKIVAKAKWAGLNHVLVKTHDGSEARNSRRKLKALVSGLKAVQISPWAWGFVYGYQPQGEAARAFEALDLGFDGYVFDMEGQFKGKSRIAEALAGEVKAYRDAHHPGDLLGYSTFSKTFHQPNVPYLEFGRYCDIAMPQDYWAVFGTEPRATLIAMCERWEAMEAGWKKAGFSDSIKPIVPTGQIVGRRGAVPASELATFLHTGRRYLGINVWRWDLLTKGQWVVLRDFQPEVMPESAVVIGGAIKLPLLVRLWLSAAFGLIVLGAFLDFREPLQARILVRLMFWPITIGWTLISDGYQARCEKRRLGAG